MVLKILQKSKLGSINAVKKNWIVRSVIEIVNMLVVILWQE